VFLNLLVNAVEAIEPGDVENNEVRIVLRREADWTVVEIEDTGRGIAPSERERIFEPFFTTKHGAGTGLGLSISHGIVTELGGSMEVRPRPERGTSFCVRLPPA